MKRGKIKYEDLKEHFEKGTHIQVVDGVTYMFGEAIEPKKIPEQILECLRKLGLLNTQRIVMGEKYVEN